MASAVAIQTGASPSETDPANFLVLRFNLHVGGTGGASGYGVVQAEIEIGFGDAVNTVAAKVVTGCRAALTSAGYDVPNNRLLLPTYTKA